MEYSVNRLEVLKAELTKITQDVQNGTLAGAEAAERIANIREEMDEIIRRQKPTSKK